MKNWNESFQDKFSQAFQHYLGGNWGEAKRLLEEGLRIKPVDGPTKNLMDVMSETGYKAPKDWPGYRVLTEK